MKVIKNLFLGYDAAEVGLLCACIAAHVVEAKYKCAPLAFEKAFVLLAIYLLVSVLAHFIKDHSWNAVKNGYVGILFAVCAIARIYSYLVDIFC